MKSIPTFQNHMKRAIIPCPCGRELLQPNAVKRWHAYCDWICSPFWTYHSRVTETDSAVCIHILYNLSILIPGSTLFDEMHFWEIACNCFPKNCESTCGIFLFQMNTVVIVNDHILGVSIKCPFFFLGVVAADVLDN